MSDTLSPSTSNSSAMGTFDAEGNYVPRQITENDLVGSFADAIEGTMVEVEDGQVVFGIVVKIDKD
ncbi:MAG: 30S ribosomal protein S1, partial [Ilumatobacteraceae bacterium]|nr:30S ribosomal protein S1 [Ilumatobacteraceae bacterium]